MDESETRPEVAQMDIVHLSEMERQDYIDQINSLKETAEQFKEMNAVLKQAFASSEQCREQAQKQIERLQGVISNLSKEISLLRKEVSKQTDYNKRHNKMSFGKKSLSSSAKQEIKKSREESKMDYDRTKVKNKHVHYGDLMDKALHYMLNGWDDLLNYRKDGRYKIDNLVAERAIRPFTVN